MKSIDQFILDSFPPDIVNLVRIAGKLADQKKQEAVVVGGVVRDYFLNRAVHELDIMFNPPVKALAEELAQQVDGRLIYHETFHTFTIHLPAGAKVDLVTAREEFYTQPAALPTVEPSTIDKDFKRRDFTMNAMAIRISGKMGELLDPLGGQKDLKAGVIRALHAKSFFDDPTRIYRAARFAGRLGFEVEKQTLEWINSSLSQGIPARLSAVRRRHEFELLLNEDNPAPAFEILKSWKALETIHPEWKNLKVPALGGTRLVDWFKAMGREKAEKQMTDLAFERKIKKDVLEKL